MSAGRLLDGPDGVVLAFHLREVAATRGSKPHLETTPQVVAEPLVSLHPPPQCNRVEAPGPFRL